MCEIVSACSFLCVHSASGGANSSPTMTARWVGARRFLTAKLTMVAFAASAACAAPVDEDQGGATENAGTEEVPPVTDGIGANEANGLGPGGNGGAGGEGTGGNSGGGNGGGGGGGGSPV